MRVSQLRSSDALPGAAWVSVQALRLLPSSQNTNIRLSGDSKLSW